jgi:hypothetical protein
MLKKMAISLIVYSGILLSGESACIQAGGGAGELRIVLIRHAEKPADGDHLSCQGLNRSLALPGVLYPMIGRPDFTYVPAISSGASTGHVRMLETVIPFAVKYNLKIFDNYDEGEVTALTKDILQKKGTVLVVWDHSRIVSVARGLGVTDNPLVWDSDDYDSIWIITFIGGRAHLEKRRQGLQPAAACPN